MELRNAGLLACFFVAVACSVTAFTDLCFAQPAVSSEEFRQYNPDIKKYEFARDLISSLSYFHRVYVRLIAQGELYVQANTSSEALQSLIDDRTRDNTELRIAKNYLTRYLRSSNGLMRKASVLSTAAYEALLDVNSRERDIFRRLYQLRYGTIQLGDTQEELLEKMTALLQERKQAALGLLEACSFFKVTMLSSAICASDDCRQLVLTEDQRFRLAKQLDAFAAEKRDWGAKPGQTTIDGCIAIVREVLEDPLFLSRER